MCRPALQRSTTTGTCRVPQLAPMCFHRCLACCDDAPRPQAIPSWSPRTATHTLCESQVPQRVRPHCPQISHEKHVEREKAAASIMAGGGGGGSSLAGQAGPAGGAAVSEVVKEMTALYAHHGEMGLKEGQTIRCGGSAVRENPVPMTTSSQPLRLKASGSSCSPCSRTACKGESFVLAIKKESSAWFSPSLLWTPKEPSQACRRERSCCAGSAEPSNLLEVYAASQFLAPVLYEHS